MSTLTDDFIQVTRDRLADPRRFFSQEITGKGNTKTYRLQAINVDPKGLDVTVNAERRDDFTLESEEGYIRFLTNPPAMGDAILVEGFYWDWFTDTSLSRYIGYAIDNYQNAEGEERFEDLFIENPDFRNVLAMAAAVEALWAEWTTAARQIDTASPEVSIPVRQRFEQLERLLQAKLEELRKAEEALNIGRYKIEMLTLRRVSRTTGRLVPIFKPQEYDDIDFYPERILPPIDDGYVP